MSLLTHIKKLINGNRKVQVWDTSAISNHYNAFIKTVSDGKVEVIVPEGVLHELSEGRHQFAICKKAYEFIMRNDDKIKIAITPEETRSWTIDEQVVYITGKKEKNGYDVSLVTSDRDQEYKAKLHGVKTKYKEVVVPSRDKKYNDKDSTEDIYKRPKTSKRDNFEETKKYDFNLSCITKGKVHYVSLQQFVNKDVAFEVLDSKGKRKIGKENFIAILPEDKVKINDIKYKIAVMHENYIGLLKIS